METIGKLSAAPAYTPLGLRPLHQKACLICNLRRRDASVRLSLALGLSRLLSLVYFWDATSSGALCTLKSWQYRWWRPWNTWSTQMCAHVAMRTATLRTVQTAQNSRNPTISYQPGRTSARQCRSRCSVVRLTMSSSKMQVLSVNNLQLPSPNHTHQCQLSVQGGTIHVLFRERASSEVPNSAEGAS